MFHHDNNILWPFDLADLLLISGIVIAGGFRLISL
jgi:hypothetical protein